MSRMACLLTRGCESWRQAAMAAMCRSTIAVYLIRSAAVPRVRQATGDVVSSYKVGPLFWLVVL